MKRFSKIIFLKHSPIFIIPGFNTVLYKVEIRLFKSGLIDTVWLSRKPNSENERLLNAVSSKSNLVICRSYKLGFSLVSLKTKVILDFNANKNIRKLNYKDLVSIYWSLVVADSASLKTLRYTKELAPSNYPETKIVVIPYNESSTNISNHVYQTALELERKGFYVILLTQDMPSFFTSSLTENKEKNINFPKITGDHKNIYIVRLKRYFPLRFFKIEPLTLIEKYLKNLTISLLIKKLPNPTLWNFSHLDYRLAHPSKNIH